MTQRTLKLFIISGFLLVATILLTSCERTTYRYKITGNVLYKGKQEPAIWYTDTFTVDSTYMVTIRNSNGSAFNIKPPYTVYVIK